MDSTGWNEEAGEWLLARTQRQVQKVGSGSVLPQLPRGGHKPIWTSAVPVPSTAARRLYLLTHLSCFLMLTSIAPFYSPSQKQHCAKQMKILSIKWYVLYAANHTHMLCTHKQTHFSLSLPLYTLDGATQFYGSCVLWQCERHRKERLCFLWCPCCCGPEEIRAHTQTWMHTHNHGQTNHNTDPYCLH